MQELKFLNIFPYLSPALCSVKSLGVNSSLFGLAVLSGADMIARQTRQKRWLWITGLQELYSPLHSLQVSYYYTLSTCKYYNYGRIILMATFPFLSCI